MVKMEIERHTEDEMLHMDLLGGQVRVMLCETTQMVQRAMTRARSRRRLWAG